MPELPEVETIRRDLLREIRGTVFEEIMILDARVIRGIAPDEFVRQLVGRKIRDIGRRGKAILFDLGNACLIVQPMMTGQLVVHLTSSTPGVEEARIVFRLSKNKTLVYNDQRLFGRLALVGKPDEHSYVRSLGPEPLSAEFTTEILRAQLRQRRSAVKVVLMDGKCVAGIGNIYASEILFSARISPKRRASALKTTEVERLWLAIRGILADAVRLRGTSMRNYRDGRGVEGKYLKIIKVYGREGGPCRNCGSLIKRIVQSQRSTFYCSKCQT